MELNEHTEELATLYVLDLLSGRDLVAFEAELENDPQLRVFVRELRDGLHRGATPTGAHVPEPSAGLFEEIRGEIGGRALSEADRSSSWRGVAPLARRAFWPAAAALLFVVNLFLLLGPEDGSAGGEEQAAQQLEGEGMGSVASSSEETTEILATRVERLRNELAAKDELLSSRSKTIEDLEKQRKEWANNSEAWKEGYETLASRIMPFFEPKDGMSRFTVIEMVDAESYAQNKPRRGLPDLARDRLMGRGNIVSTAPEEFVGPVAAGDGSEDSEKLRAGDALTPDIQENARKGEGETSTTTDRDGNEIEVGPDDPPLAFTVWSDDEQKGFLDIYNMPDVPEGKAPHLWVKSGEENAYRSVGELPELEDGNGSVFYSVEDPQYSPSEILITEEERDASVEAPQGNVILRGP